MPPSSNGRGTPPTASGALRVVVAERVAGVVVAGRVVVDAGGELAGFAVFEAGALVVAGFAVVVAGADIVAGFVVVVAGFVVVVAGLAVVVAGFVVVVAGFAVVVAGFVVVVGFAVVLAFVVSRLVVCVVLCACSTDPAHTPTSTSTLRRVMLSLREITRMAPPGPQSPPMSLPAAPNGAPRR